MIETNDAAKARINHELNSKFQLTQQPGEAMQLEKNIRTGVIISDSLKQENDMRSFHTTTE